MTNNNDTINMNDGTHSRHDERHYMTCGPCYEYHLDFMQDQEIDDAPSEDEDED